MISDIATVAVYVTDQDAAVRFWRDKVGFEVRRVESMGPAGQWIEVAPAGAQSRLVLYPREMMPDWKQHEASVVFECEDVASTYDAMKRAGVTFKDEPKLMAWGTYATFCDPDGTSYLLKG